MKRRLRFTLMGLLGFVLLAAMILGFVVVPAQDRAQLVVRLDAAHADAKRQSSGGTWVMVSSDLLEHLQHSITRVDLRSDGLECNNLRQLIPLLTELPDLEELHLPAWMSDEFIAERIDIEQLQHIKRVYDLPYPA